MKKEPSYPKITTKTNITFSQTQTQNININSPKSLAFSNNPISSTKMFKAITSNNKPIHMSKHNPDKKSSANLQSGSHNFNHNELSKSYILSQKGSKSSTQLQLKRQNSSANLKLTKNSDSKHKNKEHITNQQQLKTQSKEQIKKLEEKLKFLQKKIDTIKKSSRNKKYEQSSLNKSKSKAKDNSVAIMSHKKFSIEQFHKKKQSHEDSIANSKLLKKSHSDKNILKSRPPKSRPFKQSSQNHQKNQQEKKEKNQNQNQEEVIHKFVTQVQKNPKMFQKHHLPQQQMVQKIFYYVTNLSLSLKNPNLMIYKQHLIQSLQTFNYLQNIRMPTLKQLEKHSVNLHDYKKHRYTIVLDLDETLIHCNESIEAPFDVCLKIKFPTGEKIDAGINIRPYAIKLLQQLSQISEVIVFTASHECYANVVLDYLDPHKKLISYRLFRSHCWQTDEGIYIKDLRILKNRDLQNVLLVDNAAYSYFYQLQNGIPIIPFYDDKEDEELLYLIKYIKAIIKVKQNHKNYNTIKKANHGYFKLTEYTKFNDLEKLTKKLYDTTVKEFENYHE